LILLTEYYPDDPTKKNGKDVACGTWVEGSGAYRDLSGERKVKTQFGRPRCQWKDNIETDIQEMRGGRRLNLWGSGQGKMAYSCAC
jgi:hypothetical protein